MTEKAQDENKLSGLRMLEEALNELDEPVLHELDRHLAAITSGIAKNPKKAGSLSIDITLKAMDNNATMIAHTVEINKIKVPKPPGRAGFAFRGPDGGLVKQDPAQSGLWDDEGQKIDTGTGEVTKVGEDTNISSIGDAKGVKK